MRDEPDHEAILREAVLGRSTREIAKQHRITVAEVNEVLNIEAERMFSAEGLRREMYAEAQRLGQLKQQLFARAMEDGDLHAATVYITAFERLASMIGLNASAGHYVTISGSLEPAEPVSNTQKMLQVIRRLKGRSGA
jgi:hypothetical protein